MSKSISNPARRLRAALLLHPGKKVSVPQMVRKHGAKIATVYAVLNGQRPGRKSPATMNAIAEINQLATEAIL